jgi:hypothetical protein
MLKLTPKKRVLFVRRYSRALLVVFGVFCLVLTNLHRPDLVHAASANTVNFQARLQTASGGIVPDGNYNVEFKLYSASSGGSALWTEDYLNGNTQGLKTVNGYLSANLGSLSAFPSSINWDQQLWLTMNIGGTSSSVVATSSSATGWDGEMNPRIILTAVPYALSAGQLQTTSGSNTSKLSIQAPTNGSQTFVLQDQGAAGTFNILTAPNGSDGYIKLQAAAPGSAQTGNLNINGVGIFGSSVQAPLLQTADGSGASTSLALRTGNSTTSGNTGGLTISTGNATSGNSGSISIDVGTASGTKGGISIGTTYASGVTIGTTTGTTTVNGNLTIGSTAGGGTIVVNNGSLIHATLALGNFSGGGSIGTAATTVDKYTAISIAQTAASQTLTLPNPTASTTYGRVLYISNIGSNSFTILGTPLNPGSTASFIWQNTSGGASWQYAGADGNSILNQSATNQSASFKINGTGTAATLNATTGVQTGGTTRLDSSGNLSNIGTISGTGTVQLSGTTGSSYIMSALGLGTTNPQSGAAVTISNSSWISSVDAAGTGYINMFQVNSSNQIQVGAALNVDGGIILPTDGGQLTFADLPIDTSASAGAMQSYTFRVGSSNVLTVYGEADGSGNLQNGRVSIGSSISPAYTLDVAGDINTTGNLRVSGTIAINSSGLLQSSALSGTYSNALTLSNTGNVYSGASATLTGTAQAATLLAATIDSKTSGTTLNIGTTNATTGISLQQSTSLVSGKTLSASYVNIQSADVNSIGLLVKNLASQAANAIALQDSSGTTNYVWRVTAGGITGSGDISGGSSGNSGFRSGNVTSGTGTSGTVTLRSGDTLSGTSGSLNLLTGPASAGSSGNINITSGTASGSTKTSGTIAIDNGSISSSATAGSITIGTQYSSGITIGHSGIGTTFNSNFIATGTAKFQPATDVATAFQILNTSNVVLFGADTLNNAVSFGVNTTVSSNLLVKTTSTSAFQIQDASNNILLTADTSTGTLTFGTATNGVVFTAAGGLVASGTAQHAKTITLSAEYAGAVLDAASDSSCSSANNGTMTSGFDNTNYMNYYRWNGGLAAQCYDVIVRVPLPADFNGWASSTPLSIRTYSNNLTTSTVTVDARDTANVAETGCAYVGATPASTNTWTAMGGSCTLAGTYTANGTMTLRIRMTGDLGSDVRISTITLNYKSKF